MAEGKASGGGDGLSLQTLVVAAAASAVAAVVVSHVWRDGTVIAAAMTPVVVAIVKELLQRPMESELVRKPVSRIASGSRAALGSAVARGGVATGDEPPVTERRTLAPEPDRGSPNGTTHPSTAAPIRTYSRARRRPPHLKIAVITGIVAFAIAAAALTLPELIFGGAVSSHHSTTLFGGGGGGGSKSDKNNGDNGGSQTQPSNQPQQQTTTPSAPPSSSGGGTPTTTTPSEPPQQTAPQQTTPAPTTPVPTTPTPPAP